MKIIFSRKGMDASSGGHASPIFPDGSMASLPIKGNDTSQHKYRDVATSYEGKPLYSIMDEFAPRKNLSWHDVGCHLDPMFSNNLEWAALGQADGAEGHLRNNKVGVGDLFLFYGWFREIDQNNGKWSYSSNARDIQQVWGYLKVDEKRIIDSEVDRKNVLSQLPWLSDHPHIKRPKTGTYKECIYISREKHGLLSYRQDCCLTDMKNYRGRATWRLPECFNQPQAFTYLKNFVQDGNDAVVQFRGYGQEFIFDLDKVKSDADRQKIVAHIEKMLGVAIF